MLDAKQAALITEGAFEKTSEEIIQNILTKINNAAEKGESEVYVIDFIINSGTIEWQRLGDANRKKIVGKLSQLGYMTASRSYLLISW